MKYFYDIPHDPHHVAETRTLLPYSEVFPREEQGIAKSLDKLATQVEEGINKSALPDSYRGLAPYLRKMSRIYLSKNTDPDKVYADWQSLLQDMTKLVQEGCPIMFIPQDCPAVAGAARKVDMEIRIGFVTRESEETAKLLEEFRIIAQKLNNQYSSYTHKVSQVPKLVVNFQPFAFGPNMFWTTRGEKGENQIVAHTNAVADVAVVTAYPALQIMFENIPNEESFKAATALDNSLHELGHSVISAEDEKVRERLGVGSEATILEEIKADSGNMKLLYEYGKLNKTGKIDFKNQVYAKIGDICDYLKNKSSTPGTSGERYFLTGIIFISHLMETGLLIQKGDKYEISDHERAIEELSNLADEVLRFYTHGSPEEVVDYVANIRKKTNDEKIGGFIRRLKSH